MIYLFQDNAEPAQPKADGFKIVKGRKKSNKNVKQVNVINISNVFECLDVEECIFEQSTLVTSKSITREHISKRSKVNEIAGKINIKKSEIEHQKNVQQPSCGRSNLDNGGPVQQQNDGFNTVKWKELNNRFECLVKEECEFEQSKLVATKLIRGEKSKVNIADDTNFIKKVYKNDMVLIETHNRFHILEDNTAENLDEILQIPKRKLKKCKKCNFRKRTCLLNPSSCQANQKQCFFCSKYGHFPRSTCCKAKRKCGLKKMIIVKPNSNIQSKLTRKVLKLVKKKICELEEQYKNRKSSQDKYRLKNQKEHHNQDSLEKSETPIPDTKANNQMKLKESILKTANKCARKFQNVNTKTKTRYFTRYCIKKAQKVVPAEPLPDEQELDSIQRTLDVYDKLYYSEEKNEHIPSSDAHMETKEEYVIPQLDGANEDETVQTKEIFEKSVFAISCEINEISLLLNFFRHFDLLWKPTNSHFLCKYDQERNCLFCHLRSSCLRLNSKRSKGPKRLKLVEFTSQLNQYQDRLGWNWRINVSDIGKFIENSLKLLDNDENKITSFIGLPEGQCHQCLNRNPVNNKLIYEVETENLEEGTITIKDLLRYLI